MGSTSHICNFSQELDLSSKPSRPQVFRSVTSGPFEAYVVLRMTTFTTHSFSIDWHKMMAWTLSAKNRSCVANKRIQYSAFGSDFQWIWWVTFLGFLEICKFFCFVCIVVGEEDCVIFFFTFFFFWHQSSFCNGILISRLIHIRQQSMCTLFLHIVCVPFFVWHSLLCLTPLCGETSRNSSVSKEELSPLNVFGMHEYRLILHLHFYRFPASSLYCLSWFLGRCSTFSKASLILSTAHSVAFTLVLKVFFLYSSHSPLFNAEKQCFIILWVQSLSLQHFTCSKYSPAGDSCCHCPCTPACLSFSASSRHFLTREPFLAKIFPHLSYVLLFSHHFPWPSTMRLLLHKLIPPPPCQWLISFCQPVNRCSTAGINWTCMTPHLPSPQPTQTARSWASSHSIHCQNETEASSERWSRSVRNLFLHLWFRSFASHVVLCFFGFHPNYFPFRALDIFTFFSKRFAFPSGTFHLLARSDLHQSDDPGTPSTPFHQNFGFRRLRFSFSQWPWIASNICWSGVVIVSQQAWKRFLPYPNLICSNHSSAVLGQCSEDFSTISVWATSLKKAPSASWHTGSDLKTIVNSLEILWLVQNFFRCSQQHTIVFRLHVIRDVDDVV